jgi:dCTP deaminase
MHGMTYGLGPAGYDVRILETVVLAAGQSALATTLEHIEMPDDLLGTVWAKKFLAVQNKVIEPGWCGYLTLELSNHSNNTEVVNAGWPIAQIIFHLLDKPV